MFLKDRAFQPLIKCILSYNEFFDRNNCFQSNRKRENCERKPTVCLLTSATVVSFLFNQTDRSRVLWKDVAKSETVITLNVVVMTK